jgi:hypothetical protein
VPNAQGLPDFVQGGGFPIPLQAGTNEGEDVGLAAGERQGHGTHHFTFLGENGSAACGYLFIQ